MALKSAKKSKDVKPWPPRTGKDQEDPKDRKWTVMVFMGADTVEGNEPLGAALKSDLAEMQEESGGPHLDVFAQVHRSSGATKRYHFGYDAARDRRTKTVTTVPEAGSERALIEFVRDSLIASKHRRDDYSMLVLWGHAYDFAFARSRTREGVVDSIDFIELSRVLERFQDSMKAYYEQTYADQREERPTLDIIAFDACDVATVEMACQLQPFATFLLGSEIGIPIPGWPYDRIFCRLRKPKGRLMGPPEFGSWVVRRFCESYKASDPVSLSLLDLRQATELRKRAEQLAQVLSIAIVDPRMRDRVFDLFFRSQTGDDRPYVDVADLCLSLVRDGGDRLVADVARSLGNLLLSPRGEVVGKSEKGENRPLIVDHGRNSGELARLNGISLYAPHVASNDFEEIRDIYDDFVFARNTVWSEFVHLLARMS